MEMPTFGHLKKFPRGKLPTLKEVIGRCLFVGNFKSDATLVLVAKELQELWIECNVYPFSMQAIKKKIKQDIQEYSRLCKYDKKKRGAKYQNDLEVFLKKVSELVDIFQNDKKLLSETEKKYKLRMAEQDYEFYEDQKTVRKQICLRQEVPVTPSEERFRMRVLADAQSSFPPEHQHEPLDQSMDSIDSSVPTQASEPEPYMNLVTQQNRTRLTTLAEISDRYLLSDRAAAAAGSAALVDFGIITPDDTRNVIDK